MPLTVTVDQLRTLLREKGVDLSQEDVYHVLRLMAKNDLVTRSKGANPAKGGAPKLMYSITERQVAQIHNLFSKEDML